MERTRTNAYVSSNFINISTLTERNHFSNRLRQRVCGCLEQSPALPRYPQAKKRDANHRHPSFAYMRLLLAIKISREWRLATFLP
jgi:hypothetical protein